MKQRSVLFIKLNWRVFFKHSSVNLLYIDFALGFDIVDNCEDVSSMEYPLSQQMQAIYSTDNMTMNKVNEAVSWSINHIKVLNTYLDWIDSA